MYASDSRKSYGQKGVNDTFEIIKNGPNISNCEELLRLPCMSILRLKSNRTGTGILSLTKWLQFLRQVEK